MDIFKIDRLEDIQFDFEFPVYERGKGYIDFPDDLGGQGIYFFFGKRNELLYVGITKNLYNRIYEHMNSNWTNTLDIRHNFKLVKCISVKDVDRQTLEKMETHLIRKILPKLNSGKTDYYNDRLKGTYNPDFQHSKDTLKKWNQMIDEFSL